MNCRTYLACLAIILSMGLVACSSSESTEKDGEETKKPYTGPVNVNIVGIGEFMISEPVVHDNLQIFIIEGTEYVDKSYVTLNHAMLDSIVTVIETGSVNELAITNHSKDWVFINSGDIVKGGKQDRTIQYDVIVPPLAEELALSSFCVEQGRWRGRGGESLDAFHGNMAMVSNTKLKVAAKVKKNQSEVWKEVVDVQHDLSMNTGYLANKSVDVTMNASGTSLQLALENRDLDSLKRVRKETFENILDDHPNAVGIAYAINGKVMGVDIYGNRALLEGLWEKLTDAYIVESIAELKKEDHLEVTIEVLKTYLEQAGLAKESTEYVNEATALDILKETQDESERFDFITEDRELEHWVHFNSLNADMTLAFDAPEGARLSAPGNVFDAVQEGDYEGEADDAPNQMNAPIERKSQKRKSKEGK